jgi:hypothetical protein
MPRECILHTKQLTVDEFCRQCAFIAIATDGKPAENVTIGRRVDYALCHLDNDQGILAARLLSKSPLISLRGMPLRSILKIWIPVGSVLIGALTLCVAYFQLSSANRALEAANIINISNQGREISKQILDSIDDIEKRRSAYNSWGDLIAHAGYLHDNNQISDRFWDIIVKDFCIFKESNDEFSVWYTNNRDDITMNNIYHKFERIDEKCNIYKP